MPSNRNWLIPFTPESDQCQNFPAASQEMWHHTVWRTWLFIAYSDEKWLCYKFSLHHSYNRFLKGWENTLFELRSERLMLIFRQRGLRVKQAFALSRCAAWFLLYCASLSTNTIVDQFGAEVHSLRQTPEARLVSYLFFSTHFIILINFQWLPSFTRQAETHPRSSF